MNLSLVFESGDAVLISVFVMLVLMSVATWSVVLIRWLKLRAANRCNAAVHSKIWAAKNMQEAVQAARAADSPMSAMLLDAVRAGEFYHRHQDSDLASGVPFSQYLLRQIHHQLDQTMRQHEGGLTVLATIGSTAPFIGLFGTVWGIYHALVNIGVSGQMNIAAVAGPIGEALVSTAAGLFVAIPAVVAYNFLVRGNKKLRQNLHSFAHDLHVQLLNNKA